VLLEESQCEDMRYYVKYTRMDDVQGASVHRGDFATRFFSDSATLGRMPL
jgi:hypothetical protein